MRYQRQCEVCGHCWKSKYDYIWILLCPKCRISGYHQPKTLEETHSDKWPCEHCAASDPDYLKKGIGALHSDTELPKRLPK